MENINILPNVLKGELNMERYLNTHKEWIDSTWEKLDKKLSKVAITSRDFIPYTTKNGERHPFDKFIISKTPAARWGNPEDLAGPAIFLASDASNFVNGHILYVDGGILAYFGK